MTAELIAKCAELLRTRYIFPEKGETAAALLEKHLAAGDYDGLGDEALGALVTTQLDTVCADKHLRLRLRTDGGEEEADEEALFAAWVERLRRENYGIAEVKRLDGNVGYLDL